jgi:hypothetical protein
LTGYACFLRVGGAGADHTANLPISPVLIGMGWR